MAEIHEIKDDGSLGNQLVPARPAQSQPKQSGNVHHRSAEPINLEEQLTFWSQAAAVGAAVFTFFFVSASTTLLGAAGGIALALYLTPKNEDKLFKQLCELVPGLQDPTTNKLALAGSIAVSLALFPVTTSGLAAGYVLGKHLNDSEAVLA